MLLPVSFVSHFVPDWHDEGVELMAHGYPVGDFQSLGKEESSELQRGKKLANKPSVPIQHDSEDLRQLAMQSEGDKLVGVPAVEVPILTTNVPYIQEDEMLSWLQYPTEDTFDRPYCSEYFGELLNPHVQLLKDSSIHQTMKEAENPREGVLQSCGYTLTAKIIGQGQLPCGEGSKPLVADGPLKVGAGRASILGVHTHAGKITEQEHVPRAEAFKAVNADTAMAMGAGRASGLFSQAGAETFSGVRVTSHQPSAAAVKPSLIPFPPVHTLVSRDQRKALDHVDPTSSKGSMGNLRTFSNVTSLTMKDKGAFQLPSTFMPFQGHLPVSNLGFHNSTKNSIHVVGASTSPPNNQRSSPSTLKEVSSSYELPSSQEIEERQASQGIFQDWCLPPLPVASSQKKTLDQHSFPVESVSGSAVTIGERGAGTLEMPDTTTSPSRTSGNSNEKCGEPAFLKKKTHLNEESDYQSEEFDDVAVSAKKSRAGRGTATKRSRAAETHNESEKRRRNKINVRMKALQELIPNANKTDKASMLDEVIDYMKMLQAQLQFMCMRTGMAVPPMSVPTPSGVQYISMQQMPTLPHMNMGMGQGIGMGMGMVSAGLNATDTSWQVALPVSPSFGQPITSCQAAQFPVVRSPQPVHSSQGNLRSSSHASEPRHTFSAPGHLQPLPENVSMNSDMYNATSQQQKEHDMLK